MVFNICELVGRDYPQVVTRQQETLIMTKMVLPLMVLIPEYCEYNGYWWPGPYVARISANTLLTIKNHSVGPCLPYATQSRVTFQYREIIVNLNIPRYQSSWGQHVAHLGSVGPRWAPCWPHEPCSLVIYTYIKMNSTRQELIGFIYTRPRPKNTNHNKHNIIVVWSAMII